MTPIRTLLPAWAAMAVLGESVSDRQLAHFRKNEANRGKVFRDGLRRYSRHPEHVFPWRPAEEGGA